MKCRRCEHKVRMVKGVVVHDNRPYDDYVRCRKCITEGKYCKSVKSVKI